MTLTEFLLARIAEDEAVARAATCGPWFVGAGDVKRVEVISGEDDLIYRRVRDMQAPRDAAHIVRHDPARVLARCERDRRIVEVHYPLDNDPEPFCWNCDEETWPCRTMAFLAAIYADHPDYREEWKP